MECNMATYALTGKWMSNFCFIRTASFHALIIGPTSISVFNSGMYEDGSPTNITGSAQQDLPDEPGHLTLQFFGRPAGNYLVRHVFCYPHEIDRWNNNDCLGSGLGNGLRQLHYRLQLRKSWYFQNWICVVDEPWKDHVARDATIGPEHLH